MRRVETVDFFEFFEFGLELTIDVEGEVARLVFTVQVLLDYFDLALEPKAELVFLDKLINKLLEPHLLFLHEAATQVKVVQVNLIGILVRERPLLNLLNLLFRSSLSTAFIQIGIELSLLVVVIVWTFQDLLGCRQLFFVFWLVLFHLVVEFW